MTHFVNPIILQRYTEYMTSQRVSCTVLIMMKENKSGWKWISTLPDSWASFSNISMVLLSIPPHWSQSELFETNFLISIFCQHCIWSGSIVLSKRSCNKQSFVIIKRYLLQLQDLWAHLVDQVASGDGCARVDVANDDDVVMNLSLTFIDICWYYLMKFYLCWCLLILFDDMCWYGPYPFPSWMFGDPVRINASERMRRSQLNSFLTF